MVCNMMIMVQQAMFLQDKLRLSLSPEVDADFDAVGDGDGGDLLDLAGSALQVDVALVDGHLPLVPGLGTLTAGGPSAADAEVLVWHSHGSGYFDCLGFGVGHQLVGHLLHGGKTVA